MTLGLTPRAWRWPAMALVLVLLGGCAGMRAVDSDVTSHTAWPPGRAPGTYAFERLPSQAARPEQQARVEHAAALALAQAGFRAADGPAAADVLVQAGSRVTSVSRGFGDPFYRGDFHYGPRGGWFFSPGIMWVMESPYYDREVVLLIRDRLSHQVLYETRARNDGPWQGDVDFLTAMFQAAMADFPGPAISPRRVRVEVPLGGVTGVR